MFWWYPFGDAVNVAAGGVFVEFDESVVGWAG
jgi:hypothetical protein